MVVRQEVESTHWILLPLSPREGQEHPRGAQTSPPEIKMTSWLPFKCQTAAHTHTHLLTRIDLHTLITHTQTQAHTDSHTHQRLCIHDYRNKKKHTDTHISPHTHPHMHTHKHTYARTHTHTHCSSTCTYAFKHSKHAHTYTLTLTHS